MAMVLSAFAELFINRLAAQAEDELVRILGVKDDLLQLLKTVENIKDYLADAESRNITEKSITRWFADLRNLMYDAEDLLDDCHAEAEKNQTTPLATSPFQTQSASSSLQSPSAFKKRYPYGLSFLHFFSSVPFRHDIGKRIQGINTELEKLRSEIPVLNLVKNLPDSNPTLHNFEVRQSSWRQTTSEIVESDIVGIDEDSKRLVDLLTRDVSTKCRCPVYAITGMPGLGKTTLARKVYNDSRISSHFQVMMWVCVSETYNKITLLKDMVSSITSKDNRESEERRENYAGANTKSELCLEIRKLINNKRFFLVLDDVWSENVWNHLLKAPLSYASYDSKILITTRNEGTAMGMKATHSHKVNEMSDKEGWSMLCKVVFREEEEEKEMKKYEKIGMKIVQKCKGVPLAINAVGGVLVKDRTINDWERICSSHTWELTELPEDIKPGLLLSYYDLPSHLKQCFIYCSLFPEDFTFHRPNLVQMWIAEGFIEENMAKGSSVEDLGDGYYKELVRRNLLQEVPHYFDKSGCKMHDLIRALALYVSQNERIYEDPHSSRCTFKKLHHLPLVKKEMNKVPVMDKKHESLRTLLLSRNPLKKIHYEFFDKLTRLRVIDISYTRVRVLPDSLGNLIHLRFLGMSFTKIKSLPDSIKNLKNLETLKANGSKYLRTLPEGVNQLEKLRHLAVGDINTQLDYMPFGIGNLKRLRTLYGFVANGNTLRGGSNLKELQGLSDLSDLSVYKLENVASIEESKEAKLEEKRSLRYLRLCCSTNVKVRQHEDIKRIEEVFEGINPPQSLESVHIEGFFGQTLSNFINKCSLCHLTWLRFQDCLLVKTLPSFGGLPELIVLQIWGSTSVSKIGSEFFGGAEGFPKLQELHLLAMPKLDSISKLEQGAMRCLKKLHIEKCPKLKSLPSGLDHVKNLTKLVIEDCKNIETIENLSSITELKLKGNLKLTTILNLSALNIMSISECSSLNNVGNVHNMSYLVLSDDNIDVLPQWLRSNTLKTLDVRCKTCLVSRMCKGGVDWPIIENFLHVEARSLEGDGIYMSYRKDPFFFQSNLIDNASALPSSVILTGNIGEPIDEEYKNPSSTSQCQL